MSFVSLKKDIAPERMCMQRWDKQMQDAILLFIFFIYKKDRRAFIGTRQKTPLLAAGMNAALLLVSVMFHSLDVPLNRFAAHFSSGSNIVTSQSR